MRYHPLYEGFWTEEKLDGCSLEERGFAAYLFSNPRLRPSGIYRVTDAQAAIDTGITAKRAAALFADLHSRRFIVRDGAWIFVRGYLRLQPKQAFLLRGVSTDVDECTSPTILQAFHEQYHALNRPSANGRPMVARPSANGRPMVQRARMQSRADADADADTDAEQMQSTIMRPSADGRPALAADAAAVPAPHVSFTIPAELLAALDRCPTFAGAKRLRDPTWWQAQMRAHSGRGVDYRSELLRAQAWCVSNPQRAPKKDHARFLHAWFARADGHGAQD